MTSWLSLIPRQRGPKYLAIANAIDQALKNGTLHAGDRLPTQRELAGKLKVTVGTVSRAYGEAERRNLVKGMVGRGTVVAATAFSSSGAQTQERHLIDLSLSIPITPVCAEEDRFIARSLASLVSRSDWPALLGTQPCEGHGRYRQAGASWFRAAGFPVKREQVLVTCGCQHAMFVVFSAITNPGDLVLTEQTTYPGMKGVATSLGLELRGLGMDGKGILPEALEAACRDHKPKALYCMPTHQNPTGVTMDEGRRRKLAAIANEFQLKVVEDTTYNFLNPSPIKPLSNYLPQLAFPVIGVSKLMAPGLRVGFMAAPQRFVRKLTNHIWSTTWTSVPLTGALVAQWIEGGMVDQFGKWKRAEAAHRFSLARKLFPNIRKGDHGAPYHLWLPLPKGVSRHDLIAEARMKGINLAPADAFWTGRDPPPEALRVSLICESRARLQKGLEILREILQHPRELHYGII